MLGGNLQKVGEHGQNTTRTLKAMEEMLKDRTGGVVDTEVTAILKQDKEMLEKYYAKEIAEHHIVVDFQIPAQEIVIKANPEQLSKSFMSFFVQAIPQPYQQKSILMVRLSISSYMIMVLVSRRRL